MRTFKKFTLLTVTLLAASLLFGQPKQGKKPSKEKIKAMKVGYITEKLDLTTKEAQKFWPIYNEFDAKIEKIHKTLRSMRKKDGGIDDMTDAEVEKMIITHDELRQKELNIQKEYHAKFKAVLPIKKVAKLYKANHDFKRDLLKKIRNHKGGGQKGERGPPPGGRH
jgi:Skp family chaperone for outer membrane proteins